MENEAGSKAWMPSCKKLKCFDPASAFAPWPRGPVPQAPFKEIYLHGLVRDEKGQKMSKTKGPFLGARVDAPLGMTAMVTSYCVDDNMLPHSDGLYTVLRVLSSSKKGYQAGTTV